MLCLLAERITLATDARRGRNVGESISCIGGYREMDEERSLLCVMLVVSLCNSYNYLFASLPLFVST